jgi:hypothetical protein
MNTLFPGFERTQVTVSGASINLVRGSWKAFSAEALTIKVAFPSRFINNVARRSPTDLRDS